MLVPFLSEAEIRYSPSGRLIVAVPPSSVSAVEELPFRMFWTEILTPALARSSKPSGQTGLTVTELTSEYACGMSMQAAQAKAINEYFRKCPSLIILEFKSACESVVECRSEDCAHSSGVTRDITP